MWINAGVRSALYGAFHSEQMEAPNMRTLSTYVLAGLVCGLPITALAIEAPQLPSSAKKLSGKEIVDLQDGVNLTYKNYVDGVLVTGTAVHDFKNNQNSGTYDYKGTKGLFNGRVWLNDDMFCHSENAGRGDTCVNVYLDGSSFYNVSPEGKVLSVDTKP
jgi:hypothetical protein